ncbi:MAG: hypothetical protein JXB26_17755 [Candidatus Aminicenantes bacterium]|nr:hypothetical protein [Candidatus Aminicenantes bacterium]
MKKRREFFLLFSLCFLLITGAGFGEKTENFSPEILKAFSFRALGPARQGGRILHIAVPESIPYTFYIGTASGGVWKTENNGTTFSCVFEDKGSPVIGHLAIAPSDPNIIWVGTGDPASGRLSLLGDGVYKSTDGGKTWTFMGLEKSIHIGRIAIHPKNPDLVYAAALGYHFSDNEERGLYKTEDGGKTWQKCFYISPKVGIVDVILKPDDPDIVFCASYDKWRKPWHFEESGPESGIFKSIDSGKTWTRLEGGLPHGKLGRIGLDISRSNPNVIYATIDNFNKRPPTKAEAAQDKRRGREPQERRIGGEVYRSMDAGETWEKRNPDRYSIGGGKWYGQIRVDPNNEDVVYVPNVMLCRSMDGGKTWGRGGPANLARGVHVDHHAVWVDPDNSDHILLGNDGGLAQSYDGGKTWDVFENIPIAQFYAIGVDMEEPYYVYGGTQDTGSMKIPSNSLFGRITREDWASVGGGDGMFNLPDPEDSRWLYNEFQFGTIQRFDQKLGVGMIIKPNAEEGSPELRFNWNAPICISPHNSRIITFGSQFLHRSLNRGDDWQKISPDLTTNDPEKLKGNIEFCTLTTISESSLSPGVIWVGTDDGKVQVTQNGGGSWTDVTSNLTTAGAPEDFYVSRVFASHHIPGKAYAVKTGFQRDDFHPFVYKTEDYGQTWTSLSGNLPDKIIYVLVEDRKNPDLLFIGNDIGVFVSLDGGEKWIPFKNDMPLNPVFDLLIHPRENDLVVGTYGRGIYVADISPLQEINQETLAKDIFLFAVEPKTQNMTSYRADPFGQRQFIAPNEPEGLVVYYYLKEKIEDKVKITITDPYGEKFAEIRGKNQAGINRVVWNMRRKMTEEEADALRKAGRSYTVSMGKPMEPGEVVVVLTAGQTEFKRRAVIRPLSGFEK